MRSSYRHNTLTKLWDRVGDAGQFETRVDAGLRKGQYVLVAIVDDEDIVIYRDNFECCLAYLEGRIDGEGI